MQSGHHFKLPTFRTCNPVTILGFRHSERAIRHQLRYPDTFNTQNNLSQRQLGIRNNAHSAYWFISEYTFKPFSGYLLTSTSPPNLPFSKGRNGLSFSFTTIEFSIDISFWVAMQHISPLAKGRKRGDYLYRTDVSQVFRLKMPPHSKRMQRHFCMVLHRQKKDRWRWRESITANVQAIALQDPVSPMAIGANRPYRMGNPCRCNAWNY